MTRGVATGGDCLMCPAPTRPTKSEPTLRVGSVYREHEAAGFRYGERDQLGLGVPFLQLLPASARACARSTTNSACASRQSVMNRCHASHVRTSY